MSQRVINKAPKAAVVGTFHIFPANRLAKLGSRLLKLAYLGGLSAIAEVVSVSPAAQQFAADSFKIKSSVVPNMIDISSFRSGAVSTQRHEVVFLGRLVKRKGAQQLLQAFSLVNRQIPDSKLIIGGDGPEMPKLRSLAMQLGLSESIDFRGYIDEADKAKLLAQAEIACFPSLYGESFGIVLLEAMAAGSGIVLAGNNPGYVSVMSEVPEALFDPRDPEALAAKIIDFFEDETGSESVHQDQARLVKKFDVNRVGPQIEALYTRAIDKTSQARHN
jgi:phosphatidylinositol alpha-mannosyltransferase